MEERLNTIRESGECPVSFRERYSVILDDIGNGATVSMDENYSIRSVNPANAVDLADFAHNRWVKIRITLAQSWYELTFLLLDSRL